MNQNDYVILCDENGTPYIAHASWLDNARNAARGAANAATNAVQQVANRAKGVGRGVRTNHKYILKVNENGRTRYFYKPEEVKAYYEAKRKGIKNPAEYAQKAADAASNAVDAVKNVASKAGNAARSAFREVTGQAARDRMDEAAANYSERVNSYNKADAEYKKATTDRNQAHDKYVNAMAEREKAEQLANNSNIFNRKARQANVESAKAQESQYKQSFDKAEQNRKDAQDKRNAAALDYGVDDLAYQLNKQQYDRSLAGAVDRTAARARDVAVDARDAASSAYSKAKDAANNAVSNAKNTYERMKGELRDRAEQAGTAVKSTAKNAVDKAKDATGITVKEERDQARERKDWKEFIDASRRYDDTPVGRIDKTIENAKVDVKAGIQGMIDNARSSTAKAVNEAWDKIPKNADGTVNPFDPKFQSTYNNWKNRKDKYDNSLTGRAKDAAEKATDSVMEMIDQAKKAAKSTATSAQKALDNATGNNYRKRAQEANQAAENAINQRARTSDQLENQRSKYGSKENDQEHIYGDREGYYYKTKEQRDRAEALISKRDQYDADIVNNNRASKVNDSMYAGSKAGKINDILGRSNISTSERANSKATEVQNKWDRQEAESKLIGGRLDPGINVSKEYVYSRASNSGMASEVSKVMKLEEAMRSAERAYERLGEDSSKPQSSSRAARQKMLQAQDAYEKAYEELIDDINDQYDQDLAEYERRYGKYNRG